MNFIINQMIVIANDGVHHIHHINLFIQGSFQILQS